jgi:hypothetical protein
VAIAAYLVLLVTNDELYNRIIILVPCFHVLFLVEYMKRIKSIFASSKRLQAGNFAGDGQVQAPAKQLDGNSNLKLGTQVISKPTMLMH